ncbi:MAG: DUF721 domain-containing protein [Candidatus Kapabacteria bacterium]|nr:DUF721 domain-containing protein [Candidatus Kapabacteria bacterium]MBX7153917.1 DUF721 domain-containing protein [Bacteroidota bacterium]
MNNNAQSLKQILSQYLKERGLENIVKEVSVPEVWEQMIGDRAAKVTKIIRFDNRQLIVEVSSPVWRTELRLRSEDIRAKINKALEGEVVREIIIR